MEDVDVSTDDHLAIRQLGDGRHGRSSHGGSAEVRVDGSGAEKPRDAAAVRPPIRAEGAADHDLAVGKWCDREHRVRRARACSGIEPAVQRAVAVEAGDLVPSGAEHVGESADGQQFAVGLEGERLHVVVRDVGRTPAGIGRTVGIEAREVAAGGAADGVEAAADDDLSVRLQRQGVNVAAHVQPVAEGQVHAAVGVEPHDALPADAAKRREESSNDQFAIRLQGQRRHRGVGTAAVEIVGIQRAVGKDLGDVGPGLAVEQGELPADEEASAVGVEHRDVDGRVGAVRAEAEVERPGGQHVHAEHGRLAGRGSKAVRREEGVEAGIGGRYGGKVEDIARRTGNNRSVLLPLVGHGRGSLGHGKERSRRSL